MSYPKAEKEFGEALSGFLSTFKVTSLEKICQELIERAKSKDLCVKGPVRLPTKTLKINTRKTTYDEGFKTWETLEMRSYKRFIDPNVPTEAVKQIITISKLVLKSSL